MPDPVIAQVQGEIFRTLFTLMLSDRDATRKVNLVAAGMVEISGADGRIVKLELDEASGVLKKVIYVESQMGGPPQNVEESLSDWREVSGVKVPYRTAISQGGKKFADIKVQEFKINTGLTAQELNKR